MMIANLICLSVLLTVGVPGLRAQTHTYSPDARFETREGSFRAFWFGSAPQARQQIIDGHLRGRSSRLTALSFREGFHQYGVVPGEGRTWSSFTVDLSDGDASTASATFSRNVIGRQTRVFSGSWTWPTIDTSRWAGQPAWSYTLPFRTPWIRTAGPDVLMDFRFSGGVLANQSTWTVSPYTLDGYSYGPRRDGPVGLLNGSVGTCRDSAHPMHDAQVWMSRTSQPTGRLVLRADGFYFGPNSAALAGIGFRIHRQGIPLGSTPCQSLFLDPAGFHFIRAANTDSFGSAAFQILPVGGIPWNPIYEGVEFGVQGFWSDSATSQFLASVGTWSRIPFFPLYSQGGDVRREVITASAPGASTGTVEPPATRYSWDPIIRYTH